MEPGSDYARDVVNNPCWCGVDAGAFPWSNGDPLYDAYVETVWKDYRTQWGALVDPKIAEAREALKGLASAKTGEEYLYALAMMLHVQHVTRSKSIMVDYGCGDENWDSELTYEFLDHLQQNGLNSVYSDAEVAEFIAWYDKKREESK